METRGEGDGSLFRVDLRFSQDWIVVGGNDYVDGLDGTSEGLVEILLGDLQFEKSTIDLVNTDDWLDSLGKSLTKYGFGLDTDSIDTVDDD